MRRAALIYNPMSGARPARREQAIAGVRRVLEDAGVAVRVFATTAPGSAGLLAQEAIVEGCDAVLACGGDGTVHEALQTMVSSEGATGAAALSVIPMGTANALAMDFGLPLSPVKAAKMLLTAERVRIPVGRVFYCDETGATRSRYFAVAAGIGADGLFFSRLNSEMKRRFGYAAYLIESIRMALTHTFPLFNATFTETGSGLTRMEAISQILAVRVSNFGGLVRELAPGAAIGNGNLHVLAFKTRSRLRYLEFMAAVIARRHRYSQRIELVECPAVECSALPGATEPLFVEADGEWLGTLPVRFEVVPQALTLLVPKRTTARGAVPS